MSGQSVEVGLIVLLPCIPACFEASISSLVDNGVARRFFEQRYKKRSQTGEEELTSDVAGSVRWFHQLSWSFGGYHADVVHPQRLSVYGR